jgi:ATP-dependent DNA helicase DinG
VAYLLPGLEAAEATHAPLVVATHSKGLQDQLLEKDIPRVRELLGHPGIRATTVKGQENYLCLRKLSDALATIDDETPLEERWGLTFLAALASVGVAMELDRVSQYLRMRYPSLGQWLEKVRSHHTTTIGPPCAFHGVCHFYDSARLAHLSDVVIANHALVFQWPAHLPQIRNIVFDEAHHLEDQITEAYSSKLAEQEVRDNLDRLSRRVGSRRQGDATALARLLSDLVLPAPFSSPEPGMQLTDRIEDIRSRLTQLSSVVPLAIPPGSETDAQSGYETLIDLGRKNYPAREPLEESLKNLRGALEGMSKFLAAGITAFGNPSQRKDPAYDLLVTHAYRFESYAMKVGALLGEGDRAEQAQPAEPSKKTEHVRLIAWHPRERTWKFSVAPIHVAPLSEPFFASKRAVVLTSATLSAGISPTFVTDRIGLKLAGPPEILPSPYDLARQAVVHIPEDSGQPGTQAHFEAIVQFTEQAARILGGRTLLLMTANRRLRMAADILRERLKAHDILVFDSVSDRRAAEGFRGAERALLIGSERYGEGLDIPGRALSLVIVEKINETMTRGPLAEARKARTRFGLYDYDFPLRMMWLKQRVGRLIRSPSDTGHVVVFDSRYHQWSVGSRGVVQRALAPMPVRGGKRDAVLLEIERSGV